MAAAGHRLGHCISRASPAAGWCVTFVRMSDLERAEHWRQRAEELRVIAESMKTKVAKADLLALAEDLDRIADRLEKGRRAG
ncbi:MAG TPA: hypothetical protein VF113_09700 [Stellaceae bacterium]